MLTKKQKNILDYITQYIKKNGYAPTLREIMGHFRLKSVSNIHQHIEILKSKGYLKNQPRGIELNNKKDRNLVEIPITGTITAGQPIEAIEDQIGVITLTKDEIDRNKKYYALKVIGNSMVDEGIFDGDTVIIKKQSVAENGQTVVAIIDDNEATLKKLYREKDRFRLQPANQTILPIFRTEIEIRGVVIKIIRNLENQIEIEKTSSNDKFVRKIDYSWDFKGEKTKSYTHGLHSYPAMFIPQVARRLLQKYSKKSDTICDIFCGSGTTLVESKLLGRNSYGIDLNPLAIFLAKTKTTEIEPKKLQKEYFNLINRIKKTKNNQIQKQEFLNIDFWFKEKAIIQLAKIKKAIKEIKNEKIKNFFLAAFSETARLSSNTKNGEFKLNRIKEDKLKNFNPNVLEIFKKKAENNIQGMTEFYKDIDKKSWTKIIYGDSSNNNGIKEKSIDFILTSPPYGDSRTTVAYGQFSRLSAQWIDIFDEPNKASGIDKELLGGVATKDLQHKLDSDYLKESLNKIAKKDKKRARDVLSFYIGLNDCLKQAYKILKPNKYFALIIGNRLVKQVRIPTDFIIAELGKKIGFTCEDVIIRNIHGKRMPKKNSPTNIVGKLEETINKESIVILKKN